MLGDDNDDDLQGKTDPWKALKQKVVCNLFVNDAKQYTPLENVYLTTNKYRLWVVK